MKSEFTQSVFNSPWELLPSPLQSNHSVISYRDFPRGQPYPLIKTIHVSEKYRRMVEEAKIKKCKRKQTLQIRIIFTYRVSGFCTLDITVCLPEYRIILWVFFPKSSWIGNVKLVSNLSGLWYWVRTYRLKSDPVIFSVSLVELDLYPATHFSCSW